MYEVAALVRAADLVLLVSEGVGEGVRTGFTLWGVGGLGLGSFAAWSAVLMSSSS